MGGKPAPICLATSRETIVNPYPRQRKAASWWRRGKGEGGRREWSIHDLSGILRSAVGGVGAQGAGKRDAASRGRRAEAIDRRAGERARRHPARADALRAAAGGKERPVGSRIYSCELRVGGREVLEEVSRGAGTGAFGGNPRRR